MKKYIILGFACAFALFATSCNQDLLNIPQKGVVAYEDFYQTDDDAESALVTAYAGAIGVFSASGSNSPAYNAFINAPGDELYWGGSNKSDNAPAQDINEFRGTFATNNTYITSTYKAFYALIYRANLVIDNFYGEDGELADSQVKKRCVAEARVLRAWAHMQLASFFGTPPIVDHVLAGNERPTNSDKNELWQFIINDYKLAIPELRTRSGKTDKDGAVYITQGAAYALLGKAQVLSGDFAGAKESLKKVIDSGNYALVPGSKIGELFHGKGDGNEEKVFELNYKDHTAFGSGGRWYFQRNNSLFFRQMKAYPTIYLQRDGWGNNMGPTQKFVDALLENEPDSYRRKAWICSYEEWLTEFDYGAKDLKDGVPMTKEEKLMDPNRGLNFQKRAELYANCGWFFTKFAAYQEDLVNNSTDNTDQNMIIIRYAEVLLLYAEACAMTGDNDGLQYLNMVAERAGAPTYSAPLKMEDVKKEKWFELAWEGTRFVDLVRWGDAAKELAYKGVTDVPYLFDDFYVRDTGGAQVTGNPHKAVVTLRDDGWGAQGAGFKPGKHELYPFPFDVLELNPWNEERQEGLKQNPGWE